MLLREIDDVIEGDITSVRLEFVGWDRETGKSHRSGNVIVTIDETDEEWTLPNVVALPIGERIRVTHTTKIEVIK